MFRLENPWALQLFALIPLFIGLYLFYHYRKKRLLKKIVSERNLFKLANSISFNKNIIRFILFNLALISGIIGLANPQIGSRLEEVKREGIDIMICLDLSRSMNATDTKPSRIQRSVQLISNYIDQLHGDRVGLVVFGHNAYLQMPITVDYSAAKLFLSTLNTDIIPAQGTAIGEAIQLATESFDPESPTNKAIIIISDGENHEGEAIAAAETAAEKGIFITTIGVGTAQGAPVPLFKSGVQYDFQRDKDKNIVTSKLNESMLNEVAQAGKGKYIRLTASSEVIRELNDALGSLEKTEMESRIFTDYDDHFQYFFFAALFFMLMELLVSERRSVWFQRINIFNNP